MGKVGSYKDKTNCKRLYLIYGIDF
jgi:hypothetical protein